MGLQILIRLFERLFLDSTDKAFALLILLNLIALLSELSECIYQNTSDYVAE